MNKVTLVGRLTRDPELKFTPGAGTAVTTFTLAVNRRFKREGQPDADFIRVVVWGKQAEATASYMRKGNLMGLSGRIETRSYDGNDGTKRYVTEAVAEEIEFLTSKRENGQATENLAHSSEIDGVMPIDDEDIPF
ncbi:single-stranded DNA-binding protein [Hathewaya histolytica]|uniref:Single-stranded DNA-binding protein n=1 Tax=Hathewaya histolytica TaxID=1498 RepID=A0A4U9RA24_HATHI|nr:single-stranded DNA-binding protein [Hathewaya histolytica]VTQ88472.1 ssDNA-binding protein [Hathewaya histolytica]